MREIYLSFNIIHDHETETLVMGWLIGAKRNTDRLMWRL